MDCIINYLLFSIYSKIYYNFIHGYIINIIMYYIGTYYINYKLACSCYKLQLYNEVSQPSIFLKFLKIIYNAAAVHN